MDKIRNLAIIDSKFPLPSGKIESLKITSNELFVENISKSFHKMRTSSTQIATPNQEIEFTITLENTSDFEIFDIKIHDILPKELVFIDGSVKIDGVSYPNLNPISVFILPHAIPPFSKIIITYSAKLAEMPIGREANSMSKITFSVDKMRNVTENSNEITIRAVQTLIEIVKIADKNIAQHNGIVKFTNTITNRGAELENIAIFSDPLPKNTYFIAGSLTINNVKNNDFDPTKALEIPKLQQNETVIIEYEVKIL